MITVNYKYYTVIYYPEDFKSLEAAINSIFYITKYPCIIAYNYSDFELLKSLTERDKIS